MKKYLLFALVIVQTLLLSAQKITISGFIRDMATGEELVGASVYILETRVGTSTNNFGFYSLSIPKGNATVVVSYLGYNEFKSVKNLTSDIKMNVDMVPTSIETGEVIVSAKGVDRNIRSVDMGKVEIPIQSIKNLPQLMGETDILKTIQLLPG
ncbi:MAG TPA: hypothetical protein DCQ31_01425, partial [Bacteroidales bacterium]|nr:hypothetical protein [Bacteroidales bacterium]